MRHTGWPAGLLLLLSLEAAGAIGFPPADAWTPRGESPAPVEVEFAGRPAVRLPCAFYGNDAPRMYWDAPVEWDLAASRGVKLTVHSTNRAALGGITWYFGSGGGWYAVNLALDPADPAGVWQTTQALKLEASLSGVPEGWRRIDRVRLAVWRGDGSNGDVFLAGLRAIEGLPEVVLVRPEPAGQRNASSYAALFDRALAAWGIHPRVVAGRDVASPLLQDAEVIVLPHNPALPPQAAETARAFLDSGGKLLACYGIPPGVASAAGIDQEGYLAAERPGHFASIHVGPGALEGAPAQVEQASWNIVRITPRSGGQVIAEWHDASGDPTGHAALVATPQAVMLSHVLLRDDWTGKERLALAMLARLWPEAAGIAARNRIESAGSLGQHASFAETRQAILKAAGERPGVRQRLESAQVQREAAREQLAAGRPFEAIETLRKSERLTAEAFAAAQEPKPCEWRAFWCHDAYGPPGMSWDAAAQLLADNGFTAVIINAAYTGAAYFENAHIPEATDYRGDALAECIAACQKHGLECHLWLVCWRLGKTPAAFAAKMRDAGRMAMDYTGRPSAAWLSPAQPANQTLIVRALSDAARQYPVEGIHLDYIRFENEHFCFSAGARAAFEERQGGRVDNWPAGVLPGGRLREAWQAFRREAITQTVAMVRAALDELDHSVKLSAAVWPNLPLDRENLGQDWAQWCEDRRVDFVCPMSYTESNAKFAEWIALQKAWAAGRPCFPGIGLSTWPEPGDAVRLIEQVRTVRDAGLPGFTVFSYDAAAREVLPLLGLGLTRPALALEPQDIEGLSVRPSAQSTFPAEE